MLYEVWGGTKKNKNRQGRRHALKSAMAIGHPEADVSVGDGAPPPQKKIGENIFEQLLCKIRAFR